MWSSSRPSRLPEPDPEVGARVPEVLASLPKLDVAHMAARHLLARVHPQGEPTNDEQWCVDLTVPKFTLRYGRTRVSEGPCRLLGTWSPQGLTFLWSWANPSIDLRGREGVRALVERGPVAPLAKADRFPCAGEDIRSICEWLAADQGSLPYAGSTSVSGPIVTMLAVRLEDHHGLARGPWCTLCGTHKVKVKHMFSGKHGFVCDRCAEGARRAMSQVDARPGGPVHPELPPCFLCGERNERIYGTYSAVCRGCAAQLVVP